MTLENFFALLEQSQLLSHEQLASLRSVPTLNRPDIVPQDAARRLVERKLLTTWQAQMLLAGRTTFTLGKYRLLSELGRGGMGAVFKAEQGRFGRIVALKVMSGDLVRDEMAVARFRREIQASSALNHPNVVGAFDAGHEQNTHFLVMEYVEGEGLDALLARVERLPVGQACEIVRQAALGLQHAHEVGMAHRDIKPSNLLLTMNSQGEQVVKILDMGLARFTGSSIDETGLTRTGQVMGTPDYVAPEQAVDTKKADIRSDIFSLGCTLFRALTGRLPFDGRNVMEKLMARAMHDAPRLRSCIPQAPAELDEVLAKMLARDPAARFQTPAEVAQALEPFLANRQQLPGPLNAETELLQAGATPPATAVRVGVRSDPLVAPSSARPAQDATQNVAGETLTRGVPRNSPASGPAPVAPPAATTAAAASTHTPQSRRRVRWKYAAFAVVPLLAIGAIVWRAAGTTYLRVPWAPGDREQGSLEVDGNALQLPATGELLLAGGPGRRTLKLTRPGYEPIEGAWTLARGSTFQVPVKWKPLPETLRKTGWERLRKAAPELQARSTAEYRQRLWNFVRRWSGSDESAAASELLRSLRWPVDALSRQDIPEHELHVAGFGNAEQTPRPIVAILGDSRFRHSGAVLDAVLQDQGVVSVGAEGVVTWWDRNGRSLRSWKLDFPGTRILRAAFHPSDAVLLAGCESGDVMRCNLEDRTTNKLCRLESPVACLVWSKDAAVVAVGGNDGKLELHDTVRGELLRSLSGHVGALGGVDFSPDGTRLASCGHDGRLLLWQISDGSHTLLEQSRTVFHAVAFNPQGTLLASAGHENRPKLWNVAQGKLERETVGGFNTPIRLKFTPNGERLLSGDMYGSVETWDVATGIQLFVLYGAVGMGVLKHSADGQTLLTGSGSGLLVLWDTKRRSQLFQRGMHSGVIHSAYVSPDGELLASAGHDNVIQLWDLERREPKFEIRGTQNYDIRFTPDSRSLVVAGNSALHYIGMAYSGVTHSPRRPSFVFSIAVSNDGKTIASGGYGVAAVAPLDKGEPETPLEPQGERVRFSFSPDSRLLAALEGNTVRIWDPSTGKPVKTLPGDYASTTTIFADNRRLLTALGDQTLCLWDLESGLPSPSTDRHPGPAPLELDVSPDGATAVSTAQTETIRFWDLRSDTPKPLGPEISITPPGVPVWRVKYTPDGRHLVTANANGTIYVLRLKEFSAIQDSGR